MYKIKILERAIIRIYQETNYCCCPAIFGASYGFNVNQAKLIEDLFYKIYKPRNVQKGSVWFSNNFDDKESNKEHRIIALLFLIELAKDFNKEGVIYGKRKQSNSRRKTR